MDGSERQRKTFRKLYFKIVMVFFREKDLLNKLMELLRKKTFIFDEIT